MGLAQDERHRAIRGEGCLGRAAPSEPVFVLRGQDLLADRRVDDWADEAEKAGCSPEKVADARKTAELMRAWPSRKNPD